MSRGFRNADLTQDVSEKATAGTIEEILEIDREQAQRAAERRAHGAYGTCEDCGRPIGAERLEALPTATRCMRCQSGWEQTNRL
jgi:DnaK suppressor protein